jgi:hypothetical protein
MRNLELNKESIFLIKDLSGRGYTNELKFSDLNNEDEDLISWAESSYIGDEYRDELEPIKYIRIK